jgi:hypothetical protein
MKIRLAISLLGLAISFALPTYAQQTNTPDPKLRERFISCKAEVLFGGKDGPSVHTQPPLFAHIRQGVPQRSVGDLD